MTSPEFPIPGSSLCATAHAIHLPPETIGWHPGQACRLSVGMTGIDLEYETVGNGSMLMVSSSGTAVVVE